MSVAETMVYGLKKAMSDATNLPFFSEGDTLRGLEYVFISGGIGETIDSNAGSNTFVAQYFLDYRSNSKDARTIRNNKSKILEAFADNTYFHTATVHYYLNGRVISVEDSEDEEDGYLFRITITISNTKVG